MLACGIDIGSVLTKALILDGNWIVQGRGCVHSGTNLTRSAHHALLEACREAGCREFDITYILGTGYGRENIPFTQAVATSTACHARGAIYRYPATRTILDIGGQETTVMKIDADGAVLDFCRNDKCGAGAGRFIEATADLLNIDLDDIGLMDSSNGTLLHIANVCSVLGEVEIVNYLEKGETVENIVTAIYSALADRAIGLLNRIAIENEITLTGGVSSIRGMVRALQARMEQPLNSGVDGIYIGALGAAIIGMEKAGRGIHSWS